MRRCSLLPSLLPSLPPFPPFLFPSLSRPTSLAWHCSLPSSYFHFVYCNISEQSVCPSVLCLCGIPSPFFRMTCMTTKQRRAGGAVSKLEHFCGLTPCNFMPSPKKITSPVHVVLRCGYRDRRQNDSERGGRKLRFCYTYEPATNYKLPCKMKEAEERKKTYTANRRHLSKGCFATITNTNTRAGCLLRGRFLLLQRSMIVLC